MKKTQITLKKENIKLFEAMLCELVETYLDLFSNQDKYRPSTFLSTDLYNTGEAEVGSAEEQPTKE